MIQLTRPQLTIILEYIISHPNTMSPSPSIPPKHPAVAIVKPRAPLQLLQLDTIPPSDGEVLIRVQWAGSTPLNLHNADGNLLIAPPHVMSACFAGTVVQVGGPSPSPNAGYNPEAAAAAAVTATDDVDKSLQVGDQVFGFAWATQKERPQQEYITIPTYLCGKMPPNITLPQAASVASNFATAVFTLTEHLGLPLPWSRPAPGRAWILSPPPPPEHLARAPILVWGAASSVGQYTLQVLKLWGYKNVLAVASSRHHAVLRGLGATVCFDYNEADVVEQIRAVVDEEEEQQEEKEGIPYVVDCIGSVEGTLLPLSRLARKGTKIAVMLPVIVRHASTAEVPVYEMDVHQVMNLPDGDGGGGRKWEDGVVLSGVRTHLYPQNAFLRDTLLPEMMPALVGSGQIVPNKVRIVEGSTLLDRAEKALGILRGREVSGEKLVWRVSEEE